MIHLKYQALFSLKNKQIKMSSAAVESGALRDNISRCLNTYMYLVSALLNTFSEIQGKEK